MSDQDPPPPDDAQPEQPPRLLGPGLVDSSSVPALRDPTTLYPQLPVFRCAVPYWAFSPSTGQNTNNSGAAPAGTSRCLVFSRVKHDLATTSSELAAHHDSR